MAAADICCPSCWLWSPRGQTTCRHCGTALIHISGQMAADVPMTGEVALPAYLQPKGVQAQAAASAAEAAAGTDWLLMARTIVAAQGLLLVVGFLWAAIALKAIPDWAPVLRGANTTTLAGVKRGCMTEAFSVALGSGLQVWLLRFRIYQWLQTLVTLGLALGGSALLWNSVAGLPAGYRAAVVVFGAVQLLYLFVLVRLVMSPRRPRRSPYG